MLQANNSRSGVEDFLIVASLFLISLARWPLALNPTPLNPKRCIVVAGDPSKILPESLRKGSRIHTVKADDPKESLPEKFGLRVKGSGFA